MLLFVPCELSLLCRNFFVEMKKNKSEKKFFRLGRIFVGWKKRKESVKGVARNMCWTFFFHICSWGLFWEIGLTVFSLLEHCLRLVKVELKFRELKAQSQIVQFKKAQVYLWLSFSEKLYEILIDFIEVWRVNQKKHLTIILNFPKITK